MRDSLVVCTIALSACVLGCEGTSVRSADSPPEVPGQHGFRSHRNLGIQCFNGRGPNGQIIPLSKIIHELRATEIGDIVDVAIIFNREFVDNTYGANAIGWSGRAKGHTFRDLYRSDHVELGLLNGAGEESFRAKIDYLSESASAPSGYASLGVTGGDGTLIKGDLSEVVSLGSSMDDNFNRHGYVLTDASPSTDEAYTTNPEFPSWNFWVEYRMTMKSALFGASKFESARMQFVHASPSKFEGIHTVEVEEGDCPNEGDSDPFPTCERASPETDCFDPAGGGGTSGGDVPDPGAAGGDGSDMPEGDAAARDDPESGERCTVNADCGAGSYCDETGACVTL